MAAIGSEFARGPGRRRLVGPRRMSLRVRLTLLYGACFLIAGAAVLAITYGFVAHDTAGQTRGLFVHGVRVKLPPTRYAAVPNRHPGAGAAGSTTASPSPRGAAPTGKNRTVTIEQTYPSGTEIIISTPGRSRSGAGAGRVGTSGKRPNLQWIASSLQQQVNGLVARANGALTTQRSSSLGSLLTWSIVALGAMALISILLGWLLAGRALRPLRTMTSRARTITAENLHARLSVDVREDELGDLASTFDGVLARLERSFDAQKRFVANASHELRTPVTLERALLEVALADPSADAGKLRHVCERVLASTEQQERMIEALLALARSQGGTDVKAPADLSEIAQDALALRAQRLARITLATDLHPAPLTGDPAMVERLVANLIDNAIIHNLAEGAWITVETGTEAAGSWLRVSNSGPEVPEERISEMFEPFRRMDGERTATATGLGLGLSIVHAIADVHGATVEAGSLDGGGLRVEVHFRPAAEHRAGALSAA